MAVYTPYRSVSVCYQPAELYLLEPEPCSCPGLLPPLLSHPPSDQLNALRREKQKLVEKIMDQYRVLEPGPLPRIK